MTDDVLFVAVWARAVEPDASDETRAKTARAMRMDIAILLFKPVAFAPTRGEELP